MATERRTRTLYWACLLAILLTAALLRFYRLDASSLWSDEGNTWAMLDRGYGEIAGAAAADIHPPGYYWLLKAWSGVFGASAWAMRSFSALAGVLLVLVVERIGRRMAPDAAARIWLPLLAALLAAVNPLLVYYSQEARMYMLLALAGAGVFWCMLATAPWRQEVQVHPEHGEPERRGEPGSPPARESGRLRGAYLPAGGYVLFAALGLWTHYSFAIVLAAANLAWFGRWLYLHRQRGGSATWRTLGVWAGLNALALLAFLPWLPAAVNSVLHWPKGGVGVTLAEGLEATLRTLTLGPLRSTPQPAWAWVLVGGLLPLVGLGGLLRTRGQLAPTRWFALPLALWLGLPVALMAGLGLFSDAFLKFLIAAAPAWCLLGACAPLVLGPRDARAAPAAASAKTGAKTGAAPAGVLGVVVWTAAAAVAAAGLIWAAAVLPPYYGDAQARDNYQGIAAYIKGVADPQRDLVVLDAPGQAEVWRYYDPGVPVLALPATRPPAPAAVEAALAAATAGGTEERRHVYALFWATDEADPDRLVETWLDRNAFKALDVWQGNVRLATYVLADDLLALPMAPVEFDPAITLGGQAQPQPPQTVPAGDAVVVQLRWDVRADVDRAYKVSVQLLDAANQVIAQRDGEPVGGSRPTDTWRAGEEVLDNYALPIPLGTPPGEYRLVAAMYDPANGRRLSHPGGDSVALGTVLVERSAEPLPPSLIPMQHAGAHTLGPVTLLGYDAYRKDYAHAPATPLMPGDLAHFVFYWQSPAPLPPDWPGDLAATLRLGGQSVTFPLAGAAFPTAQWQGGEIVRGQVDIPYDGSGGVPQLEVGGQVILLAPLPTP